ncbi:hypothetical protein BGAL_0175g00030 [Botrytis galanthina]|uniref:Uncharacterized protein n=1 Tax=Botrytis galanthina TaxID=278940 RepID=A0A4V4HUL5_9HELO|nr:hypothetical protein BGAL_0175g00030 [Botrytis galanthina]
MILPAGETAKFNTTSSIDESEVLPDVAYAIACTTEYSKCPVARKGRFPSVTKPITPYHIPAFPPS